MRSALLIQITILEMGVGGRSMGNMKQGPVRRHVEEMINRCLFQMANSAPGASTEIRHDDTGRNWEEIG